MEKLKFKAYHKDTRLMYTSPDELQHLGSWFDAHLSGALADTSNIVIIQYTNINDKHGKEDYNLDICKYKDCASKNQIGIIHFNNGMWELVAINGDEEGNQNMPLADTDGHINIGSSLYLDTERSIKNED